VSMDTLATLIARFAQQDAIAKIARLDLELAALREILELRNAELAERPPTHRVPSAYPSYEVARQSGCVLIYGAIPPYDYSGLRYVLGDEVVQSRKLAALLGATFAIGLRADIGAFIDQLNQEPKS